jgi:branched-subunit amino acid transport protein
MTLPDAYAWTAIVGLVVVVFVTRNVFLVLPARWQPRGALERALRTAPLAALVALTVPAALDGAIAAGWQPAVAWHDARLPAAVATLLAARWAGSPFVGLAAGVLVLFSIGEAAG